MTLLHWEKVRRSELACIIPFWGTVDAVVNGGLPFELPALKPFADRIFPAEDSLRAYGQLMDARLRFLRIRGLLASVEPLDEATIQAIPGESVIREFIGGSTLKIPHND
jgi:uridine kinase